MDHKHTLDVPNHADNDASQPLSFLFPPAFYDIELGDDDDVSKPVSKFTSPIYIEMGDEGSELLESKVNEKVRLNPRLLSQPADIPPLDQRDRQSRRRLDPPQ